MNNVTSHIPNKSVKTFASDSRKIMNLFLKAYKRRKTAGAFDDKYIEYNSEADKQLSTKEYLETLDHTYVI